MDPTFAALIAVVIAFPVLAIVSFVLVLGSRERLKRLDYRLALLERRLADLPGGVPSVPSALPEALAEAARDQDRGGATAPNRARSARCPA